MWKTGITVAGGRALRPSTLNKIHWTDVERKEGNVLFNDAHVERKTNTL